MLFLCLSGFAILVSCLGLLGMATYSIQSRIKEIAIRKVNGAQQKNVVMLISRSYIILLLIASIIAMPLAYMINNLWLQFSASRVPFGIGNLLIGVIIIFIFGMITISAITYRAAGINPARSLKYE